MHSLVPENWLETILQPRTLWATLWAGLVLLTVALFVLTRTRWGQARPISKCAVLSLFAHLLLIVYASTTQLFLPRPAGPGEGVVEIEVATEEDGQQPLPHETADPADPPPWEQMAADPPEITEPEQLARATPAFETPDPQADPDAVPAHQNATARPPPCPTIRALRTCRKPPWPRAPTRRVSRPLRRRKSTRRTSAADSRPPWWLRPRPAWPACRWPPPPQTVPLRDLASAPPLDQSVLADRLQRLAELPPVADAADAAAAPSDQVSRATNRADASWQSVDPSRVGAAAANPTEVAGGDSAGAAATPSGFNSNNTAANSSVRMVTAAPTAISVTPRAPSERRLRAGNVPQPDSGPRKPRAIGSNPRRHERNRSRGPGGAGLSGAGAVRRRTFRRPSVRRGRTADRGGRRPEGGRDAGRHGGHGPGSAGLPGRRRNPLERKISPERAARPGIPAASTGCRRQPGGQRRRRMPGCTATAWRHSPWAKRMP